MPSSMSGISFDSELVLQTAKQMETDNNQLKQLLEDSKTAIENLRSYYSGPDADATYEAYQEFSNKFIQTYYDVLDQYVKFLRDVVAPNYTETSNANVSIADAYR